MPSLSKPHKQTNNIIDDSFCTETDAIYIWYKMLDFAFDGKTEK